MEEAEGSESNDCKKPVFASFYQYTYNKTEKKQRSLPTYIYIRCIDVHHAIANKPAKPTIGGRKEEKKAHNTTQHSEKSFFATVNVNANVKREPKHESS